MTTNRTELERIVEEGFLSPAHAAQLRAAGMKNGPQLVAAWRITAERQRLVQTVDLTMPELMRAVFAANLLSQTAPGVAAIDTLLQHKEEMIREFQDIESDHKFICQNRQGILQYVGQTVYENWNLSNEYLSHQKLKSYARLFGLAILLSMGGILSSHGDALLGKFGPDVTSQLNQALYRREALNQAVAIIVNFSVVGAILLAGLPIISRLIAWFTAIIDRKMGRTPRDVLVLIDAQQNTPPIWAIAKPILNGMGIFLLIGTMLMAVLLPASQVWIDWLIFGLSFSWMLIKVKGMSVRFSQIGTSWAKQARPRQAGLFLLKEIVVFLFMGVFFMVMSSGIFLSNKVVDAWTQAQVQAARSDLHSWLMRQTLKETDPNIRELEQLVWETTQSWVETNLNDNENWALFMLSIHMFSVSIFSMAFGVIFGWFYFIRYQRWIKFFLAAASVYLVIEIAPELVTWWLSQAPETNYEIWLAISGLFQIFQKMIVNNMFGLTIGLFFALGQEIYDSANDHDLNHECPNCHLLHVAPCCEFERIDKFDQELPLKVS